MKEIIKATFESDFAPFTSKSSLCETHSATLSTEQKRTGSKSCRIELRDTDNNCTGHMRAEVCRRGLAIMGYENWISAWVFHPSDYAYDTIPELFMQMVSDPAQGSPNWAISLVKDQLYFGTNTYIAQPVSVGNPSGTPLRSTKSWLIGALQKGRWVNYTVYQKMSNTGNGRLKLFIDGVLVKAFPVKPSYGAKLSATAVPLDLTQVTLGTRLDGSIEVPPYLKFGIYKWQWPDTPHIIKSRVFYFDEVAIGNAECALSDFFTPVATPAPPVGTKKSRNRGEE